MARRHGPQEGLAGRAAAAVMSELEHVGGQRAPRREQLALGGQLRVAGQQQRARAVAHAEHDRAVVDVAGERGRADRAQHLELRRARAPPLARAHHLGRQRGQRLEQRGGRLAAVARPPHPPDRQRRGQLTQAAHVVGVRVGEHQQIDARDAPGAQVRHHHPLAGADRADIDDHHRAAGQLQHRGVALAHGQEGRPQRAAGRRRQPRQRRHPETTAPGDRARETSTARRPGPAQQHEREQHTAQTGGHLRRPHLHRRQRRLRGDAREDHQRRRAPARRLQQPRARAHPHRLEHAPQQRQRHQHQRAQRRRRDVGQHPHQRHAPEVPGDDGQRGQRRRRARPPHRQARAEEPRPGLHPRARLDAGREPGIEDQQAEQRAHRQLEPGITGPARAPGHQDDHRPGHRGQRVGLTTQRHRQQHHQHHQHRAQRRQLAPHEAGVGHHQRHREHHAGPLGPEAEPDPRAAPEQPAQTHQRQPRDDRHVQAADRHQVREARDPEHLHVRRPDTGLLAGGEGQHDGRAIGRQRAPDRLAHGVARALHQHRGPTDGPALEDHAARGVRHAARQRQAPPGPGRPERHVTLEARRLGGCDPPPQPHPIARRRARWPRQPPPDPRPRRRERAPHAHRHPQRLHHQAAAVGRHGGRLDHHALHHHVAALGFASHAIGGGARCGATGARRRHHRQHGLLRGALERRRQRPRPHEHQRRAARHPAHSSPRDAQHAEHHQANGDRQRRGPQHARQEPHRRHRDRPSAHDRAYEPRSRGFLRQSFRSRPRVLRLPTARAAGPTRRQSR